MSIIQFTTLKKIMSHISMEMFLAPLPVVYTFHNFEMLMSILSSEMFLTPLPVVYTFHNFEIVNVNSLDRDVPHSSPCRVYISQL